MKRMNVKCRMTKGSAALLRISTAIVAFWGILMVPGTAAYGEVQGRRFGAGIVIGSPTGITGKYWLDRKHAIDGVFSIPGRNEIYLHADYLWHDFAALPKPEEGRLPLYYGVGGVASPDDIGVRGVIGVSYIFADYPFEIFLELGPVFSIAPDVGLHFSGGLGARYYFG